ncbi:MAG: PIG-L deacetylase family protein, partial [Saccharofermentanales bacterium]
TTRMGNGFLNEYIPMEKTARQVRISIEADGRPASVARLTAYSRGSPPEHVQQWAPPLEKADMLVLPTHADDELLYFGGVLPTYAGEQKKKVQVAYLTYHDTPRTREQLAGLWITGVVNYPVISSFPDQYAASYEDAKRVYSESEVLGFQIMLLRRFRPDVVVGHDLDGEYGHGMHIMNARMLTQALTLSEDPAQYPESAELYGTWTVKKCYLHLYDENKVVMDWLTPLAAFDGLNAWEVAKLAYAEHVSQHVFKYRVRIEGPNDCRLFGLYFSAVGPDTGRNDLFENIIREPEATATPSPGVTAAPTDVPVVSPEPDPAAVSVFSRFKNLIIGNPKAMTAVLYILFVAVLIVLIRLIFNRIYSRKDRR